MDRQLRFSARYTYDSNLDGITIPVVLNARGKKIELLAKIDTGASDCLFEHELGGALGLRVEEGVRKTYATANSRFEAYGHELPVEVLGSETTATVYFFADAGIDRNVLGRRDQAVYISRYDE
jgi:hypothetical protein